MNTKARVRRYGACRNNVQVPCESASSMIMSENGATRPTSFFRCGAPLDSASENAIGPHTSPGENLKTSTETPTASCPAALTIQEPTLAPDECNNVRRIALYRWGSPGRGSALPKEADTRRPHPRGDNSGRSATHHQTRHAAPAKPRLSPSFTSHFTLASEPPRP